MLVSLPDGDMMIDSADEIEAIIRKKAAEGVSEVWISDRSKPYPALAVLLNREYACVDYFGENEDDMWRSVGSKNTEVVFSAGGTEWTAPTDAVISVDEAVDCLRQFCNDLKRPVCIKWQDGV